MFILSMLVTVIYTIITGNKVNVYWCVLFFKPPNAKSKPMNPLWLVLGLRHKEHLCRRSKKSGIRWFRYEFQSNIMLKHAFVNHNLYCSVRLVAWMTNQHPEPFHLIISRANPSLQTISQFISISWNVSTMRYNHAMEKYSMACILGRQHLCPWRSGSMCLHPAHSVISPVSASWIYVQSTLS
jgi:hypothetical protein